MSTHAPQLASRAATPEPTGGLERWLPAFRTLRSYEIRWLAKDLVAGVVLTAVLVPVGMGYAQAAGLPPVLGLYASVTPLIVYAILGPSRVLVLGPDSGLIGIIAATVLPLAGGDPQRASSIAAAMAILAGVLCVVAGFARAGFVADLISKPIRYGFLNGIAFIVLVSQLPKLFGFRVEAESLLATLRDFATEIWHGRTNLASLVIGVSCLAIIGACKRWAPRIPGVLLAIVSATLAVWAFDLTARFGVGVLGEIPSGLPSFEIPELPTEGWWTIAKASVALALVAFTDTIVLTRTLAIRAGRSVDSNQELVALGAANVATGFFQGFAVSASSSRTPIAESSGAKSQLACLVAAAGIALLLVFAPTLLATLPTAALAAVVIAACFALVELGSVRRLFRLRRAEFVLSLICFLGVALIGTVEGIFFAVAIALLTFVWRAWRPYFAVLGRVDGLKGYHDITRHPEARRVPGLVLFRWDAPLFFANAETFRDQVQRAVRSGPTETRWIVVAAEPVTDVDTTAADMLASLDEQLRDHNITLAFAGMKDPVKDHLHLYGLFSRFGAENFFPTLGQAVDAYLERNPGIEWRDWDEREDAEDLAARHAARRTT